jgi:hypothetical protein
MRILADSRRLAQPTAPRVHARVRSGVPISISISTITRICSTLGVRWGPCGCRKAAISSMVAFIIRGGSSEASCGEFSERLEEATAEARAEREAIKARVATT